MAEDLLIEPPQHFILFKLLNILFYPFIKFRIVDPVYPAEIIELPIRSFLMMGELMGNNGKYTAVFLGFFCFLGIDVNYHQF